MSVNEDASILRCPYCGAEELILEDNSVTIERIKANAYRDVELEKLRQEDLKRIRNEEWNEVARFKNSWHLQVLLWGFIIAVVITFLMFSHKNISAGFLAVLQAGLFGLAWAMRMRFIKLNSKLLPYFVTLIGLLLAVPILMKVMDTI